MWNFQTKLAKLSFRAFNRGTWDISQLFVYYILVHSTKNGLMRPYFNHTEDIAGRRLKKMLR